MGAGHPSRHRTQTAEKFTSAVDATLPLRPGAAAQLQYALVYAIDCSGVTGKPHSRMSSVVCASETSVASYPRARAPCRVERMHSSVCAPVTTTRPTPRSASSSSRSVASNESPYVL